MGWQPPEEYEWISGRAIAFWLGFRRYASLIRKTNEPVTL